MVIQRLEGQENEDFLFYFCFQYY